MKMYSYKRADDASPQNKTEIKNAPAHNCCINMCSQTQIIMPTTHFKIKNNNKKNVIHQIK